MENKILNAKKEAAKKLEGMIDKKAICYNYYLNLEIKKILEAEGIDWTPKDGSVLTD